VLQPSAPREIEAESAGRDGRREGVLEAAAREFNARGVGGASFAAIARSLGLTRAALYYYVKDREDLVRKCYAHSCALMAADLAAARATEAPGLERLMGFLRRSLDPERPPTAALSDIDYLAGDAREAVWSAHGDNIAGLRALLREGVADGSLRRCDDEVIAQALFGVITWIPLSIDWVDRGDPTFRSRTVQALIDLITDGQAAEPSLGFSSPVEARAFFPPSPAAFDRAGQAAAKVEQLLMTASQIINRRGVDGTSLDDVAGALGATKGVLYHYLKNKTDLVVRCYRRAFDLFERFADAADALGATGLEKGLIGLHLNVQAHAVGLSPLIQMVGVEALPTAARREIRRRARALQRRYAGFGELGIEDGSNRAIDLDATAQLGAGVFEWLPKWFDPADPRAAGALAGEIERLFIAGLRRR
jgi:AcrR family transcriptional regulator